ncbi:hypothetical protein IFM89_016031 [Coptis chinensis]|uniref:Reverse transcriptase domain-containing protein n=1 Tax=Coptis chinensis TaxID=261450 RepID=A0A835H393_9MAGN|nr:hypothetical protein IFM89_016031 [Coptis chinensis]
MCLAETKANKEKIGYLSKKLKLEGHFAVPAQGQSGGLVVLWKEGVELEILGASKNQITGKLANYFSTDDWFFSFVYGEPAAHNRNKVWNELRGLAPLIPGPWCLFGDFNAIAQLNEKIGGKSTISKSMHEFNNLINDLGLVDLGFKGPKFTWSNNRRIGDHVLERLDRAMASTEWIALFPHALVQTVANASSDHISLIINLDNQEERNPRPFKFFNMWLANDACKPVIEKAWNAITHDLPDHNLIHKLHKTRTDLSVWNKFVFGNIFTNIKAAQKDLDTVLAKPFSTKNYNKAKDIKANLLGWYEKEEDFWKQKSTFDWIKDGGKNTRFYHLSTIYRRRKNKIDKIKDDDGEWREGRTDVGTSLNQYFTDIFTTDSPVRDNQIMDLFKSIVSDRENEILISTPDQEDIWKVVKKMGSLKSPGPDGFQGVFYKKCWDIVGPAVVSFVQDFFNTGYLNPKFNETYIALIPKVVNPDHASKFRPISLCNFGYKVVSKILANRLKGLMNRIISPFQGAFIKGRSIGDNVGLACEVFHNMKNMKSKKEGWCALKMDMAKAYDRVEWAFVDNIFEKLGFSNKWRHMIHQCLSTVSFQIMLNGSPLEKINPERGLRQGDPLSPYLFILVSEALSRLIAQAEAKEELHGVKIRRNSPALTHLLYADDLILFIKANLAESGQLKHILECYCRASGQKINYEKSSVFFSRNVSYRQKIKLKRFWRMKNFQPKEKYLGVPIMLSRKKAEDFDYLVDRIHRKVKGWKAKALSQAGRTTLIQAVIQATPLYVMSTYLLPMATCNKMDKACRDFWWNGTEQSKSVHTIGWEQICKSKQEGGLGLRKTRDMNKAMLAKLPWKAATDVHSLWTQTMFSIYGKHWIGDVLKPPDQASYFWKGIHKVFNSISGG